MILLNFLNIDCSNLLISKLINLDLFFVGDLTQIPIGPLIRWSTPPRREGIPVQVGCTFSIVCV